MAEGSINRSEHHDDKHIVEMMDQRIPDDPKAKPPPEGQRRCGNCQELFPATEGRCPHCDAD